MLHSPAERAPVSGQATRAPNGKSIRSSSRRSASSNQTPIHDYIGLQNRPACELDMERAAELGSP